VFDETFVKQFEDKVMMKTSPYPMRFYQMEALVKTLTNKKSIAVIATGGGKSLLIHNTMQILRRTKECNRILVVVPNISLVEQLYSNIKDDYSYPKITEQSYMLYGGTSPEDKRSIDNPRGIDRPYLITTYQSIMRKPDEWFSQWDCLLIDEVHGVSSNGKSLKEISQKCYNAKYKIGYTGTLGDNEADKLTTVGYVGPVSYTLKSKTLIDLGILSAIKIKNYILRYDDEFSYGVRGLSYPQEVAKIETNEDRNQVFDIIFKNVNPNEHMMVLAKHIKHMDQLQEYFEKNYGEQFIIHRIDGKVSGPVREQIRQDITNAADGETHLLLTNFATGATGLNVPNLHHIIFAASYKGKIKVLQALGRGLRKYKGKLVMYLHDIVDDLSQLQGTGRRIHKNAVYKHYEHRLEHYAKEEHEWETFDIEIDQSDQI
jgi:superfamily II DNA or RNA helicase